MNKMMIDRKLVEFALEALEWHYRQGHSNTLGGLRLKIDEKTLRNLKAALAEPVQEPDLSRCPKCNGPADNGHDREVPPNPYYCTKCMAEPETCTWQQDGDSDSGVYGTSCGHYFDITDGTPEDNKMKWCCYCGRKLTQALITEDEDE